MKRIDVLALIAGIIFVGGGIALLIASFFVWFLVFHGLVVLIIGIVILATLKKQEFVEPIKKEIKRGVRK